MTAKTIEARDIRIGDYVGPWRITSVDCEVFTLIQARDCDHREMADRVLVRMDRPPVLMSDNTGDAWPTKRHWFHACETVTIERSRRHPSIPTPAPAVRDEMAEHDPWESERNQ